jgi:hypothetical protein
MQVLVLACRSQLLLPAIVSPLVRYDEPMASNTANMLAVQPHNNAACSG